MVCLESKKGIAKWMLGNEVHICSWTEAHVSATFGVCLEISEQDSLLEVCLKFSSKHKGRALQLSYTEQSKGRKIKNQ